MSDPFVYSANPAPIYPDNNNYHNYHPQAQAPYSPFIPPVVTPLGSPYQSPYSGAVPLPPSPQITPLNIGVTHASQLQQAGSPSTITTRYLFPDGIEYTQTTTTGSPKPKRKRTISWHTPGVHGLGYNEFLTPGAPPDSYFRPRRGSVSAASPFITNAAQLGGASPAGGLEWNPYTPGGKNMYTPGTWGQTPLPPVEAPVAAMAIHPFMNPAIQHSPGKQLVFDLASPTYNPYAVSPSPTGGVAPHPLSVEESGSALTWPPITRLRIICDIVPQWPVDLVYPAHLPYPAPPITLTDVLTMLHRSFLQPISHLDWAKLGTAEEALVTRAYKERCKAHGRLWGPGAESKERNEGVKRVDFLAGRTMVRGLMKMGGGGGEAGEIVKLVLSGRQ